MSPEQFHRAENQKLDDFKEMKFLKKSIMKRANCSITMKKKFKMEVSSFKDNFDSEFVLMPWDDKSTIIIPQDGNTTQVYSRWELIQKLLHFSEISSVEALINTIKSYNVVFNRNGEQSLPNWNFLVLSNYFTQLDELERKEFFQENGILSTIRKLSLQLKELVPSVKVLKAGAKSSNTFHQLQIASILGNAFFCTFPKGTADCPSINFNTLYEDTSGSILKYYLEKIKCLMHYFKRIHQKQPSGLLSFHRLNIPDHKFPRWDKTNSSLCSLKVDFQGRIEDQVGFLQMDFANKYVGGGVLGKGCVQEEIRFLICPELIAARLFTECLADNESLLVVGAERYCQYSGYSNSFEFAGNYVDTTPFDENRHRKTYLIILDALYFHRSSEQYRESKILRELKKAYVGFTPLEMFKELPLATGNWGCGAFGGDPQLKSLLQLMASSEARRDILYLTFGNFLLKNQIEELYFELKRNAVTVGTLYRIIRTYNRARGRNQTVFEFVISSIKKLEKRKFSPKSVPSTSQEAVFSCETKEETANDYFPPVDVDFDELDKVVQENFITHFQIPSKSKATSSKISQNYFDQDDNKNTCNIDLGDYLNYLEEGKCDENKKTAATRERYPERRNFKPSLFSDGKTEKRSANERTTPIFHPKPVRNISTNENNKAVLNGVSLGEYMFYLNEFECKKSKRTPSTSEKPPALRKNSLNLFSDGHEEKLKAKPTKNLQVAPRRNSFLVSENKSENKKLTQAKITDCFSKK